MAKMLDEIRNQLKNLPAGKTQTELAAKLGIRPSAVSRIASGDRQIKAQELPTIIEYLEINPSHTSAMMHLQSVEQAKIVGVLERGMWREVESVNLIKEEVSFVPHPSFESDEQVAMAINDDHCDLVAPRGSHVIIVDIDQVPGGTAGLMKRQAKTLVVVRNQIGKTVQNTMRELVRGDSEPLLKWCGSADQSEPAQALSESEKIAFLVLGVQRNTF